MLRSQARAAILDYRAEHNITSPVRTASRFDRYGTGPLGRELEPFYTLDRIAFWQKK